MDADLKEWLEAYLSIEGAESRELTPYIHCFVSHLPEFIEKYGDINLYNVQGLEKVNDFATQYYHGSTNKHKKNNAFVLQMINKRNRVEFFQSGGELLDLEAYCPLQDKLYNDILNLSIAKV